MPTVAQLQERILHRLGEDPASPVYYTAAEALEAVNEAQRFFALATLCLEKTGTLALTVGAGNAFYSTLATFTDFLVPLRVRVENGAALRPATLGDLDAWRSDWTKVSGQPSRYCWLGLELLALTPQAASATNLLVTYAHEPAALTSGAQTPAIPEEYHQSLADAAVHILRTKEGGAEFASTGRYWARFLEDVDKMAGYVRRRSLQRGYDNLPAELREADKAA